MRTQNSQNTRAARPRRPRPVATAVRAISRHACVAALPGLLMAAPVRAGPAEIVPPDPWQIIHKVRSLGPAKVGRDAFRDPEITADLAAPDGSALGLPYRLTFYGCDMGRNCSSILLTLRLARPEWEQRRPPYRKLAAWNRGKLLGRAWVDDRRRVVLDHAVVMGPGLPAETLSATLLAWAGAIREFAEYLDYQGK